MHHSPRLSVLKWMAPVLLISCSLLAQRVEQGDSLIRAGIEAMTSREHSKSLELLTRAKTLAEDQHWHSQHFLALNNMGANYYAMLDYGEALNYYLEAYTLAIKELGPSQEMVVLNNIAILYLGDKDYDKAREYLEKAYTLAKNTNNKKKIVHYAVNLGLIYNEKRDLESADRYLQEALRLTDENPTVLTETKIALADYHYLKGDYPQSVAYINELLPELEKAGFEEYRVTVLLILSKIYWAENKLADAIKIAGSALSQPVNLDSKILVYKHLSDLYASDQNYLYAMQAKDSILRFQESLNQLKNGRLYETNRVKFEIENYRKELQQNAETFEAERTTYYQAFGGVVFVMLILTWGFRNSHLKNRQNKLLLQRNNEIITLELEKEKSDNLLLEKQMREKETLSLLEQERLKNEIESRNRKLSAKALYLSERNELISSLIGDLSENIDLKNNLSIKNQIKKLKSLLKTDAEWEAFILHFEEVNQSFLKSLRARHPELNANDIRYISYIYMNLSHKEIAAILHITPEACRKRKERIAKKTGIADSSLLFDYLASFS